MRWPWWPPHSSRSGSCAVAGAASAAAATKGIRRRDAGAGAGLEARAAFALLPPASASRARRSRRPCVLHNDNDHPIDVHVDGIDGFTSDATGASYDTPYQKATRHRPVDRRCRLPRSRCSRAKRATVDFTVRVPADYRSRRVPRRRSGCTCRLTTPSTTVAAGAGPGDVRDHAAGRARDRGGDRRAGSRESRTCK